MKITSVQTNEELEAVLNRILFRVSALEKQVILIEVELAAMASLVTPDEEFDS